MQGKRMERWRRAEELVEEAEESGEGDVERVVMLLAYQLAAAQEILRGVLEEYRAYKARMFGRRRK